MKSQFLCLFHVLYNRDDSDKELHSSFVQDVIESVRAILVAELLLELEQVPTVLMMVLVIFETLPHPYEPPVKTEMEVQCLAPNAVAPPERPARASATHLSNQLSKRDGK